MSNPAIVLMTDPSRCSLGDAHYLLQALLEMRQMGGQAMPQAFCDHPAAARDFIAAYAHAYPQLVLQGQEIPTPDHLSSLMAAGQIGALARPPESGPNPALGATRPAEQNGNGFPIVVLTLGTSQVLMDALQQSPGMNDSIRLIDIVPDGADSSPVSIADAVAIRGLEGDSWEHDGSAAEQAELDDIGGTEAGDPASLASQHDPMNLDVVETEEAPASARATYEQDQEQEPAASEATPAAQAAEPAVAEPPVTLQDDGPTGPAEPALEVASPAETSWSGDTAPVELDEQSVVADTPPPEGEAVEVTGDEQSEQSASSQDGGDDEEGDVGQDDEEVVRRDDNDDDDVEYPPVGSLIAGADVLYDAVDQSGPHGALHELAAVILDDGIVDLDLASDALVAHQDEPPPAPASQEEILAVRSADNVVTIEDLYGSLDPEGEDSLADSGTAPHVHDSDL
jgi:hypothetical protein